MPYTAEVHTTEGGQTILLPPEITISSSRVNVRREGEAIILEPPRPTHWPAGFFDAIHIADPAFERPLQGNMPPSPRLS